MVDVWWGLVEQQPQKYVWTGYANSHRSSLILPSSFSSSLFFPPPIPSDPFSCLFRTAATLPWQRCAKQSVSLCRSSRASISAARMLAIPLWFLCLLGCCQLVNRTIASGTRIRLERLTRNTSPWARIICRCLVDVRPFRFTRTSWWLSAVPLPSICRRS